MTLALLPDAPMVSLMTPRAQGNEVRKVTVVTIAVDVVNLQPARTIMRPPPLTASAVPLDGLIASETKRLRIA